MKEKEIKKIVREHYKKIAASSSSCCSCSCQKENTEIAESIGYRKEEINNFSESNLGLGCGNPTALGKINKGETVLDLGSGAGFDSFLAADKVGPEGIVIGVDMTEEMIFKAKTNVQKYGYKNVFFKLGDIEDLPIKNNSVDVIISNCVINLAPNKEKVFKEAFRVLKPGGRMYVSDIVLLSEISKEKRRDKKLIGGCVGGALLKDDYINLVKKAGFTAKILDEDKDISKRQYQNIDLESLKLEAKKL